MQPQQPSTPNSEDLIALQQLLAQELARNESALAHGGNQAALGLNPEMVADLQRSVLAPANPLQSRQVTQPQQSKQPLIMCGMVCLTALAGVWMIAASLPGARGTAEVNTAVMAMAEATTAIAENQKRPNNICFSLWCGGRGNAQDEQRASAPATARPVETYQDGVAQGQAEAPAKYAPILDDPTMVSAAIDRAKSNAAIAATEKQQGYWNAMVQYLEGQ